MSWQIIATSPDCMRRWGDEFVVYDPVSGDTHLLNLAAGFLLHQLQQHGAMDSAALYSKLQADTEADSCAPAFSDVQQILEDLQSSSLIAWI